jgi:hypothetical protein
MTVSMSKPTLESTLEGLVRLHWSQQMLGLRPNKQDAAANYWQRGIREGIAAILFKHRGDSLPRFKTIPMIYESDVNAIMRDHATDFVHGGPENKQDALDEIQIKFAELAVPKDLLEIDESERKRLVLAGEEKATPQDIEWITEMAEAKRREVEEIMDLLKPVGWEKVNDAPVTKYPRTEPQCAGMCGVRLSAFYAKEDYANHLILDHAQSHAEARRFAVAGWSRLTTYLQAKERAELPFVTSSGEVTPTSLGEVMGAVIGVVRSAEETRPPVVTGAM